MPTSTSLLRFIQTLPTAQVSGDFSFKDLPGSGKRIDILCRDLAACFDWGPLSWPKESLEFVAVLADEVAVTFRCPIGIVPIGEVDWAVTIANTLKGSPPDFVSVELMSFGEMVTKFKTGQEGNLWVLDENGTPIEDLRDLILSSQNSFMLGDHQGFDSRDNEIIENQDIARISLGDLSYLSSHCVSAIISKMERMVA
jgi:tRNA (pseudouridine54-N1)-methyltransferase